MPKYKIKTVIINGTEWYTIVKVWFFGLIESPVSKRLYHPVDKYIAEQDCANLNLNKL